MNISTPRNLDREQTSIGRIVIFHLWGGAGQACKPWIVIDLDGGFLALLHYNVLVGTRDLQTL